MEHAGLRSSPGHRGEGDGSTALKASKGRRPRAGQGYPCATRSAPAPAAWLPALVPQFVLSDPSPSQGDSRWVVEGGCAQWWRKQTKPARRPMGSTTSGRCLLAITTRAPAAGPVAKGTPQGCWGPVGYRSCTCSASVCHHSSGGTRRGQLKCPERSTVRNSDPDLVARSQIAAPASTHRGRVTSAGGRSPMEEVASCQTWVGLLTHLLRHSLERRRSTRITPLRAAASRTAVVRAGTRTVPAALVTSLCRDAQFGRRFSLLSAGEGIQARLLK
jgi:hypothetical protein